MYFTVGHCSSPLCMHHPQHLWWPLKTHGSWSGHLSWPPLKNFYVRANIEQWKGKFFSCMLLPSCKYKTPGLGITIFFHKVHKWTDVTCPIPPSVNPMCSAHTLLCLCNETQVGSSKSKHAVSTTIKWTLQKGLAVSYGKLVLWEKWISENGEKNSMEIFSRASGGVRSVVTCITLF